MRTYARVYLWTVIVMFTLLGGVLYPPFFALLPIYAWMGFVRFAVRAPRKHAAREAQRKQARHIEFDRLASKL